MPAAETLVLRVAAVLQLIRHLESIWYSCDFRNGNLRDTNPTFAPSFGHVLVSGMDKARGGRRVLGEEW